MSGGPAADVTFAAAPRIGLEALGAADLQRRVDRKYLLTTQQLGVVAEQLRISHALLEVDGLTRFAYRSSYLDTPSLECFFAHRQGRRLRWKARTRLYADSGRCRFEVKLKTGRGQTNKCALVISADEYGTVPSSGLDLLTQSLATNYRVLPPVELVPSLTVSHLRSTLVARHDAARFTVDYDLVMTAPDGRTARLREDLVLVETKSERGRSTADVVLREAGIRPVSVSKYCAGIALTRAGAPAQPWRPMLQRNFYGHDLSPAAT